MIKQQNSNNNNTINLYNQKNNNKSKLFLNLLILTLLIFSFTNIVFSDENINCNDGKCDGWIVESNAGKFTLKWESNENKYTFKKEDGTILYNKYDSEEVNKRLNSESFSIESRNEFIKENTISEKKTFSNYKAYKLHDKGNIVEATEIDVSNGIAVYSLTKPEDAKELEELITIYTEKNIESVSDSKKCTTPNCVEDKCTSNDCKDVTYNGNSISYENGAYKIKDSYYQINDQKNSFVTTSQYKDSNGKIHYYGTSNTVNIGEDGKAISKQEDKIFSNDDIKDIEKNLNAFLKKNPQISENEIKNWPEADKLVLAMMGKLDRKDLGIKDASKYDSEVLLKIYESDISEDINENATNQIKDNIINGDEEITDKQISTYINKINNHDFTEQILAEDMNNLEVKKKDLEKCKKNDKVTCDEDLYEEQIKELETTIYNKCGGSGDTSACVDYASQEAFTGNLEDANSMLKTMQGTDCTGALSNVMCTIMGKKNAEALATQKASEYVEEAQNNMKVVSSSGIKLGKDEVCKKGDSYEVCQKTIETKCKSQKNKASCENKLQSELDKNSNIDAENIKNGNYNNKLIDEILKQVGIETNVGFKDIENKLKELEKKLDEMAMDLNRNINKYESLNTQKNNLNVQFQCAKGYTTCEDAIDKLEICQDDKTKTQCNILKASMEQAVDQQVADTGLGFNVLALLQSNDAAAMDAVEMFNAEINLLDKWGMGFYGKSTATTICEIKIGGYLDKDTTQGGVTKYGCTEDDEDINENGYDTDYKQSCQEVVADLRAHMTPILPNNTSTIYYSYYLKFPEGGEEEKIKARYTIGIYYKTKDGEHIKDILKGPIYINDTTDEKTIRIYEAKDYQFENADNVDFNSTKIALVSYLGHDRYAPRYERISMPLVPASSDSYSGPDNSAGNQNAQTPSGTNVGSTTTTTNVENHDLADMDFN